MFKRRLISFLGLPAAGILLAAGLVLLETSYGLAASEPEMDVDKDGPYYEGPVYFGFSDFSADRESIEDRLIFAISEEYEAARAAGLTPDNEAWPVGGVYVAAYSFTNVKLAVALAVAVEGGCEVTVVMDKKQSQGKGSLASYLASKGVTVYLDSSHNAMHSKYIICLSQHAVYTGSYNFTENAKKNAENIVGFRDNIFLTAAFVVDFMDHIRHSEILDIKKRGNQ